MMRSVKVMYNGERAKARVAKYSKTTRLEVISRHCMVSVPTANIKSVKISRPFSTTSRFEYVILSTLLFVSIAILPINTALTMLTIALAWFYWYKLFQSHKLQRSRLVIVTDSLDHNVIIEIRNKDVRRIVSKIASR